MLLAEIVGLLARPFQVVSVLGLQGVVKVGGKALNWLPEIQSKVM